MMETAKLETSFDYLAKLADIARLPDNWDTYDSPPITAEAIRQAVLVAEAVRGKLAPIAIAPVPGGGIQFELAGKYGREAEIEIKPNGDMGISFTCEMHDDLPGTEDVVECVRWLVSGENGVEII